MPMKLGFCFTGSFCTFSNAFAALEELVKQYEVLPIFSEHAAAFDTRFGKAAEHIARAEELCGRRAVRTIPAAEPIGPKGMTDLMIVAPCTGNTMGKLANSITDTAVTMAVKSHLRNAKPVVLAIATNDALAGSLKNIGLLHNMRHYYFVPYRMDNSDQKPTSLVSDFLLIPQTVEAALNGEQLQPISGWPVTAPVV